MSTTQSPITSEALIAELHRFYEESKTAESEGMTSNELQQAMGTGNNKTTSIIRQAMLAGVMTCRRVRRVNVIGDLTSVPAYFIVAKNLNPERKRKKK